MAEKCLGMVPTTKQYLAKICNCSNWYLLTESLEGVALPRFPDLSTDADKQVVGGNPWTGLESFGVIRGALNFPFASRDVKPSLLIENNVKKHAHKQWELLEIWM